MLHERVVPLAGQDAVAVRNQADTVVFYSDRLSRAERRFLRKQILAAVAEEGQDFTITVPAGATAGQLRQHHSHAPLTSGAILLSVVAAVVAAAVFAAAVILLAEVRPLPPRDLSTLRASDPQPAEEAQPTPPGRQPDTAAIVSTYAVPIPTPSPTSIPPSAPNSGVPPSETAAPDDESTEDEALDAVLPDPTETSPPDTELPDVQLPDTQVPDVELPETEFPDVELPDTELPDVELPDTELPDVELPDTELPDVELPDSDNGNDHDDVDAED